MKKTTMNSKLLKLILLCLFTLLSSNFNAQDDSKNGDAKEEKNESDGQTTGGEEDESDGDEDDKEEQTTNDFSKTKTLEFGITQYLDFNLPEGKGALVGVKLEKLQGKKKKRLAREYYQRNYLNSENDGFKEETNKIITFEKKDDKTYTLKIPPLEANSFYRIKVTVVDKEPNLYSAFRLMHKEGNDDYFFVEKKWMSMIKEISKNNGDYKLFYTTTKPELLKYKDWISKFDMNNLNENERIALYDSTFVFFPILNFKPPSFSKVKHFADSIQKREIFKFPEDYDIFNSPDDKNFTSYYDYINIYNFFLENLKSSFDSNPALYFNDFYELVKLVKGKIQIANKSYLRDGLYGEAIKPNYIKTIDLIINSSTHDLSTYTEAFETGYKRFLTPDFGFVTYGQPDSENFRGTPFVGVNVALAPMNKNVPLDLSDKDPLKRLALHVGVTLESIAEENRRDDFFANKSLMLGFSYKFLTQATRFNFGGVLYKELDAINGNKSLAIYPYVGLSIDLEIRTWLHALVPSLTGNFKKD